MDDVGLSESLRPALGFSGGVRPDLGSNRSSGSSFSRVPDTGQSAGLIICLIIGFIIGPDFYLLLTGILTGESFCVWQ